MTDRPQRKRSTPIGKFSTDRCVCAPQRRSAGTRTSPSASFSMRTLLPAVSAIGPILLRSHGRPSTAGKPFRRVSRACLRPGRPRNELAQIGKQRLLPNVEPRLGFQPVEDIVQLLAIRCAAHELWKRRLRKLGLEFDNERFFVQKAPEMVL